MDNLLQLHRRYEFNKRVKFLKLTSPLSFYENASAKNQSISRKKSPENDMVRI